MDAITESPGRYRPVSHKYDTINRRYKFFKTETAACMEMYYPLSKKKSVYRKFYQSSSKSGKSAVQQKVRKTLIGSEMGCQECEMNQETYATINSLPDDVLLAIFWYFHPIDLIHCISLVCRRWNNVANHPALFTEVRVLVNIHSLELGSAKRFFERTSQYLRKLCINCSVKLPCAEVNALFDNICMPNVKHLDISSFDDMNATLLRKLSKCFPNIETLHMEGVTECSENCNELLELFFDDENTFPKIQNFFTSYFPHCYDETDVKLVHWKRALKVLHINDRANLINFRDIATSAWKSTLTVLDIGYFIKNEDFRYVGMLHNLKVFSLTGFCRTYTISDSDFLHLKNLCNLEELRLECGEDCCISQQGFIDLFTLPEKEPEKSFPYKLRCLALTDLNVYAEELLHIIAENCPNLRALNLDCCGYLGDNGMEFIVKNLSQLVFLDLSRIGQNYRAEIWNDLLDEDLPNLRFLKLHLNELNIEALRRFNLKRPKLLISTDANYIINWAENEKGCVFFDTFGGDINAIMNDLCEIEGFSCCGPVIYTVPRSYEIRDAMFLVRSSSVDRPAYEYPRNESAKTSTYKHSV